MTPPRWVAIGLIVGLLVGAWLAAHAQTPRRVFNVTWEAPPLQYADGAAMPAGTTLYGYEVAWHGATSEAWMAYDTEFVPPDVTTASIPVYCGSYTASVSAIYFDPQGNLLPSGQSNTATYDTGVQCPANMFQQLGVQ